MNRWLSITLVVGLLGGALADVYMHVPAGSNNRLNDEGENARNQNRLFDSQNNAKGGYNVGVGSVPTAGDILSGAMRYFEGTNLTFEWTNQHACGDYYPGQQGSPLWGSKLRECEIVIQMMCEAPDAAESDWWMTKSLRNGLNEETPPEEKDDPLTGQHESREYYANCKRRQRNQGLFTADRRLQGNTAIYTRQNNNGNRRGYECPEERDYYPYWHPTPWIDLVVMTNNPDRCDLYKRESQNVKAKNYCTTREANTAERCSSTEGLTEQAYELFQLRGKYVNQIAWWLTMMEKIELEQPTASPSTFNTAALAEIGKIVDGTDSDGLRMVNSQIQKLTNLGEKSGWKASKPWKQVYSTANIKSPECKTNLWTRSNHNGNARDQFGPYHYSYTWNIPKGLAQAGKPAKCVIRLRYNMSSSDYDNWNTFSWGNFDKSVIENNPQVPNPVTVRNPTTGQQQPGLQLTINTNQVARTFEDRSHVFFIHTRADHSKASPMYKQVQLDDADIKTIPDTAVIHNLNVRGKRGNIVQTYPAVEYDFVPNVLTIKKGEYVHFQWTGSNTNPRNYAGQGTGGTDRSNVMQIKQLTDNIPLPLTETTMWGDINSADATTRDQARKLYYAFALLQQQDPLLNDADPYFTWPPVLFTKADVYHYLCSRNNNFSNRSQKGTIIVKDA